MWQTGETMRAWRQLGAAAPPGFLGRRTSPTTGPASAECGFGGFPADIVASICGAHAYVMSAAELATGLPQHARLAAEQLDEAVSARCGSCRSRVTAHA
jgi:hypothetical protein